MTMTKFSLAAWKKMLSSATILLLATSVAHATKYRAPVVDEDVPEEEEPIVPVKKVKVVKQNPAVTLSVPKSVPKPESRQRRNESSGVQLMQAPTSSASAAPKSARNECIETLKEYNASENAHIKEAVAGSRIFTTWYDQNLPVSITIRPEGKALVSAPGRDPRQQYDVALCLDDKGPYLKFNGHSIRLYRGQLRAIAFNFEGYNLRFTTKNPSESPANNPFGYVN